MSLAKSGATLEIAVFLFFASTALADAALIICEPPTVTGLVPFIASTGVPIDVQPAAVWTACREGTLRLTLSQDGEVLAEEQFTASGAGVSRLTLTDPLLPLTEYTLVVEGQALHEVVFTTGEGLAQAPVTPTVQEEEAWAWKDGDGWLLNAGVWVRSEDPGLFDVVVLLDEDGEVVDADMAEYNPSLWLEQHVDERPEEVCLTAAIEDAAGVRTEQEPICMEVESNALGCSSAAAPAGLLFGLMGLLLARRP